MPFGSEQLSSFSLFPLTENSAFSQPQVYKKNRKSQNNFQKIKQNERRAAQKNTFSPKKHVHENDLIFIIINYFRPWIITARDVNERDIMIVVQFIVVAIILLCDFVHTRIFFRFCV